MPDNFEDIIKDVEFQNNLKDLADHYRNTPQEKIVETICPCCQKKLRLKVKI